MSIPTNADELREYCLRRLGKPVITINVATSQIDDRIEDALQFFGEYHFDGAETTLLKHTVTQVDIDNGYITVPTSVLGINKVFPLSTGIGATGLFSYEYQMQLNGLSDFKDIDLLSYTIEQSHLSLVNFLLHEQLSTTFTRTTNKLTIDQDWSKLFIADVSVIMVECIKLLDPTTTPKVFNDIMLKEYTTALIQRQWGQNLSKYEQIQMPGGVTFSGAEILRQALETINRIEDTVQMKYEVPPMGIIG